MPRRRALMAARGGEFPMFNPTVGITENTKLDRMDTNPPYLVSQSGIAVTDFIYVGTTGNFVYFNPLDTMIAPSGTIGSLLQYDKRLPGNSGEALFSAIRFGCLTQMSLSDLTGEGGFICVLYCVDSSVLPCSGLLYYVCEKSAENPDKIKKNPESKRIPGIL